MPIISFTEGPLQGQQFNLPDRVVRIGRNEDNDLTLTDGAVSGHHAELRPENGRWEICDMGSSNGTDVNNRAIETRQLADKDVVAIGSSRFTFQADAPAAAPQAEPESAPERAPEPAAAASPAVASPAAAPQAEPESAPERAPEPAAAAPAAATSEDEVALVMAMKDRSDRIRTEVGKVIVGQRDVLDEVLMCILAGGHALLIGLPGMAKTLMVSTIASVLNLRFKRVQFTPDLMPTDIIGTDVLESNVTTGEKEFRFIQGPIFCNLLLADEINRTPPKTQAALLEAMQEKRVTAGNETYTLDKPFFVLATQNPLEQEGTYPLPEAQLDRFMFNIWVDYPEEHEEELIISNTTSGVQSDPQPVLTQEELLHLQDVVRKVPVSAHVVKYAIRLVRATRPDDERAPDFVKKYIACGAGPRAGQYLILGAKSRAVMDGRIHVSCQDVRGAAVPVLRHRLLTNFTADSEGLNPADLVTRLLEAVEEPSEKDYAS